MGYTTAQRARAKRVGKAPVKKRTRAKAKPQPVEEEKRGSGKRGPGKATLAAREAIGKFVDGNAHCLQKWLDQIADGMPPQLNERRKPIPGTGLPPDPVKAAQLFIQVIEYHVPKLQRTEHAGDKDRPVRVVLSNEDVDL